MSTLILNSAATHRTWLETAIGRAFLRYSGGIREGQTIAARYHRLSRMSRAELAQHGLTRGDVNRAALMGF
jgi:hypothetical protein